MKNGVWRQIWGSHFQRTELPFEALTMNEISAHENVLGLENTYVLGEYQSWRNKQTSLKRYEEN